MKKYLTIIGNAFLVFLFIVGILIAYSLLPIKNNYKIYFVTSGSMEPAISTGSMVVSKPRSSYAVGDIITFKNTGAQKPEETTTHRVVEVQTALDGENKYLTKGDANNAKDNEYLPSDRIVGKTLFSVPLVGYLVGYIKTLPGLLIIIIIPAVIIIYEETKKIKNEASRMISARKERKKKNKNNKKNVKKKKGKKSEKNN